MRSLHQSVLSFSFYKPSGADHLSGMFLTDLVHVNDQFPNLVDANGEPLSSTSVNGGRTLVNFVKLQRFSDVINNILKFSSKPYILNENPSVLTFIDSQLSTASA